MDSTSTSLKFSEFANVNMAEPILLSNSNMVAAVTIDPTTLVSQALGGFLGSPAVLAVPILAAFSVASLLAWGIVSYANPADPDE